MKFSPDFDDSHSHSHSRRWWGFAVVLGLHALVAWGLTQGLATAVVQFVKPPVQVTLVAEATAPPPPPPEPVKPKPAPLQKVVATVPLVTPQVVQAAVTEVPSPMVITSTPPAPPAAPQVVAAPTAAPATQPAPQAAPPSNVSQVMGLVCPKQVQPVMPRRAAQEGINGQVEARATVRAGRVVAVEILSAKPRGVFETAVRQAMLQYQCDSNAPGDVMADQVFEFRLDQPE